MGNDRSPLAFMSTSQSFEDWYSLLELLASDYGISVADVDAWRESFDQGLEPWAALVADYPELDEDEGSADGSVLRKVLDPEAVATAIKIPVSDWPGNCYAIASQMVEAGLVTGRAVYGHYLGRIRPGTLFSGKPIVHHGWVVTADGQVIDPTRWVFEGVAPYIHYATTANSHEYDEGGNVFLLTRRRPAPAHDQNSVTVEIPVDARPLCSALLSRNDVQRRLTTEEAHWLATLSLILLGDSAKKLYEALVAMGFTALIPIDNRKKVIG